MSKRDRNFHNKLGERLLPAALIDVHSLFFCRYDDVGLAFNRKVSASDLQPDAGPNMRQGSLT